eukprot:6208091-Pleurochrysis_carterae.AAC.1
MQRTIIAGPGRRSLISLTLCSDVASGVHMLVMHMHRQRLGEHVRDVLGDIELAHFNALVLHAVALLQILAIDVARALT